MILAAGRGERMRPLTDHIPKPLLPIAGKPIIVWLIERLVQSGNADIVINISHFGELIRAALGSGAQFGAHIEYSHEHVALETAGGIAHALPLLGTSPFIVVNGDVFCDFDFAHLNSAANTLTDKGTLAHLVLVDNPPHHSGGDFCLIKGLVAAEGGQRLTFSGIGVYHPALFATIASGARHQLAVLLRTPIAQGRVSGEHHAGTWTDVGTPERLQLIDQMLTGKQ
jgi:MurNAc alpha-1-phosphate uridylyltransferase